MKAFFRFFRLKTNTSSHHSKQHSEVDPFDMDEKQSDSIIANDKLLIRIWLRCFDAALLKPADKNHAENYYQLIDNYKNGITVTEQSF